VPEHLTSNQRDDLVRLLRDESIATYANVRLHAADEIERLRSALENIAASINGGWCCHVETDLPHDLRACLRRIANHAKDVLARGADEPNAGLVFKNCRVFDRRAPDATPGEHNRPAQGEVIPGESTDELSQLPAFADDDDAIAYIEGLRLDVMRICKARGMDAREFIVDYGASDKTEGPMADLKYLCPHKLDSRYCPTCETLNGLGGRDVP
jgi:hypothetical protein